MEALIYFALWAALIFLLMRFGCGAHVMGRGHARHGGQEPGGPGGAAGVRWVAPKSDVDPVCGKTVHPERAKPSLHDGMVYYFCSRECRERFEAAPDLYIGPKAGATPKLMDPAHD